MTGSAVTVALRRRLRRRLVATRRRTLGLVRDLAARDVHDQFVAFMSPLVWDLGHVGNFEELWLLRELAGRAPHDPGLDRLYNPFENPRWVRRDLPLPTRGEILPYLAEVRAEALAELERLDLVDPERPLVADGYVHRMLAQHESQHQETMLQAMDLRGDVAVPALPPSRRPRPARAVDDQARVGVPAGPVVVGTDRRAGTYDNERPAHRRTLDGFAIDRFPVTARRYARFVGDGGYRCPGLWSERGWASVREQGLAAPRGWEPDGDGGWRVRRLGRLVPLDPREPVQHVGFFEAEAFARWAGGRLPTEFEWEKAAGWDPSAGARRRYPWGRAPATRERANVGLRRGGPAPVGSYPGGASAYGVEQLAGDVYEWTSSSFEPYPGFDAFPYEEYSQVFFDGDWRVLRGSSWAADPVMARVTYRNWDHPYRRQLFAGLRVAYDLDPTGHVSDRSGGARSITGSAASTASAVDRSC